MCCYVFDGGCWNKRSPLLFKQKKTSGLIRFLTTCFQLDNAQHTSGRPVHHVISERSVEQNAAMPTDNTVLLDGGHTRG